MDKIEAIREKIGECDDIIIEQLAVRMSYIQEIISYKKATGIPILQPEQEKKQTDALKNKLGDNEFEDALLQQRRRGSKLVAQSGPGRPHLAVQRLHLRRQDRQLPSLRRRGRLGQELYEHILRRR